MPNELPCDYNSDATKPGSHSELLLETMSRIRMFAKIRKWTWILKSLLCSHSTVFQCVVIFLVLRSVSCCYTHIIHLLNTFSEHNFSQCPRKNLFWYSVSSFFLTWSVSFWERSFEISHYDVDFQFILAFLYQSYDENCKLLWFLYLLSTSSINTTHLSFFLP